MGLTSVAPVGVAEKTQEEEKDGQRGEDKDEAHWGGEPWTTVAVVSFTASAGRSTSTTGAAKTTEEAVRLAT